MLDPSDIRMGDTVRLRNGETVVSDGIITEVHDADGTHVGPFVSTKSWDRYLVTDVVEIVERNPRSCVYCSNGVTSSNPDCDYCRHCHYSGRHLDEVNAESVDAFRVAFPEAHWTGVEHTGGGCFWLAVRMTDGDGPYYAVTDGQAGIPALAEGEGWFYVCRYADDEDCEGEIILDCADDDPGFKTAEVIAAIRTDLDRRKAA